MRPLQTATLWCSFAAYAQAKYVWPAKSDFLEDLYAMQDGVIRFGFTDLVVPCGFNSGEVGRQLAAEWIRTVFHDTITHDKAKGTGGLDASIMFETERSENNGAAFNHTLNELHEFVSPRSSGADMLALSLVASVASCGGQKVPLRMGRVDAVKAGPTGVPKPEHKLQSAMAAFTKAGFSQQEMIALVACGHTVGGVHSTENPGIAGGKPSPSNKPRFDRTSDDFDNAVVKEYLSSDGVNPLVFGRNQTTNSDKRIFGSDRNVTMAKMKDPKTFQSTCASVFERLINTVPSGVKLSPPIELVDVKPYIDKLEPATNPSRLAFEGKIRVRTSPGTGRDPDTLQVSLRVLSRNGKRTTVKATRMFMGGGQSFGFFQEVFSWYTFATELDASAGLRTFDIHLKSGKAKEVILDNQGTGGFPLQDGILLVQAKSCQGMTVHDGNLTVTVEAALRNDLVDKINVPVVQMAHKISQPGAVLPRISVRPSKMVVTKTKGVPNYTHYVARINVSAKEATTTFDIEMKTKNGLVKSEFNWTNRLSSCQEE
ncbi:heme peroxidase [Dactylonectria estremocensis]|uniref:Peroxidase n=1 Tax=Dactylonectria estremocensis TaxID=1079267 RepID=A0A9P9E6E2_9HYPO|nr:heme peroxidase [Dactylonectria estremocensis]